MIVDGKGGGGNAGGDTIAKEIEDGVRNKGIKALVVRVDSPGGSVLASERIRQALLEAKPKKIPVVVSMGSVAASGGYWVSTPANFIYAEPSTITGSIGVFGVLPSFQGTLQKLGIGADGVKTTPLSGEPDLLRGPSPEANTLIQSGVKRCTRASSTSSPQRGTRRRSRSTRSPKGACGTAARRTRSAWSTASAAWTRRSPRRRSSPISVRRAWCPLSRAGAQLPRSVARDARVAGQRRHVRAAGRFRDHRRPAAAAACCVRSQRSGRSWAGRASRRAALNARRSRRHAWSKKDLSLLETLVPGRSSRGYLFTRTKVSAGGSSSDLVRTIDCTW